MMKIVIDIPGDLYEGIERRDGALETEYVCDELMKAVDNGTPLEQEPCDDAISRQALINKAISWDKHFADSERYVSLTDIQNAPSVNLQEPKTGECKDCKWWKDSDGAYRRGIGAESRCPINDKIVYDGIGYCYMFKPQESEE